MKQSIEQDAAARKAKQEKTKRKLVAIEPETEEPELLSDIESPNETESESGHEEVDAVAFVVVRYARKNRHPENVNDTIDVTFCKRSGDRFILPDDKDSDSVDRSEIASTCPMGCFNVPPTGAR